MSTTDKSLADRIALVPTDHLVPEQVEALVARIDAEHGRIDVLVNDIFGGDFLAAWDTPVWKHSLDNGLRLLRLAIDTHLVTAHYAFPLLMALHRGGAGRGEACGHHRVPLT